VRRRGSHIVRQRRTDAGSVTVPIPDHRELAIGTLLSGRNIDVTKLSSSVNSVLEASLMAAAAGLTRH
jgi:hypothetical protein